jgi:hypothetical protein
VAPRECGTGGEECPRSRPASMAGGRRLAPRAQYQLLMRKVNARRIDKRRYRSLAQPTAAAHEVNHRGSAGRDVDVGWREWQGEASRLIRRWPGSATLRNKAI